MEFPPAERTRESVVLKNLTQKEIIFMAKAYKDMIVNEADAKVRYDLIDREGNKAAEDVRLEVSSPIEQQGDMVGAKEINLLIERSDDGLTLKNKALEAAQTAQNTANAAQSTANAAIPNSKKSTAVNSTSTDTVATSSAVKAAYDQGTAGVNAAANANNNANGRVSKSGDEITGRMTFWDGATFDKEVAIHGNIRMYYTDVGIYRVGATNIDLKAGGMQYGARLIADAPCSCKKTDGFTNQVFTAENIPSSSKRYKENIKELPLEKAKAVLDLKAVTFDWKKGSGWNGESISFIAEDAAKVDNRFVYEAPYMKKAAVTRFDEDKNVIVEEEPAVMEERIEGLTVNAIIAAQNRVLQEHEKEISALREQNAGLLALLKEKGVLTEEELNAL